MSYVFYIPCAKYDGLIKTDDISLIPCGECEHCKRRKKEQDDFKKFQQDLERKYFYDE
jgi:7-cyano-7-deazaguanine synthase in queuosine biosynthesis